MMCPMCNDVLDAPVLLPCGHSACERCVFTDVAQDVICPVGCGLHAPGDVFPDQTKREAVNELRILCRWAVHYTSDGAGLRFARDGCQVDMRLSSRHRHEGECPLRMVPCGLLDNTDPARPLECPAVVRHQMLPHHRRACPFREERCRRCRQRIVVRSRLLHERTCTVRDCPFFCGAAIREDDLMRHIAEDCMEAPVTCGFVDDGGANGPVACHHTGRRSELAVHQRDCEFRPVPCQYCEQDVAQRRGAMHAATCEAFPVECPNGCGKILKRGEVKYHCYAECPEQTVPCEFTHFGCIHRHLRANATEHETENAGGHVKLVASAVEDLQRTTSEQAMEIKAMRAEMDAMRLAHARDTALMRAELDAMRATHAAEALATQSELDGLRQNMKESLDTAASTARGWSAHEADYARRMYTEFNVVRKMLDSQVHERFTDVRELRLTLQSVSMKVQDETDEARRKAMEVSTRTREELAPVLTQVQSEIVEVKASMKEDQFEHQTKITRLSQEVDTLRSVIHNILSEASVDHFWPERRVVMANAHAGSDRDRLPLASDERAMFGISAWENEASTRTRGALPPTQSRPVKDR